jgi:hypothetical protein
MSEFTPNEIKKSRAAALDKILQLLTSDDIEGQFAKLNGNYHSAEKFIVSWIGNYHGMLGEYSLVKCDPLTRSMTGSACVYTTQGLFHEHEYAGYPTFELGLIKVAMKLCPKAKWKEVLGKAVEKYNQRIKQKGQS